jgi:hypothetical protein
MHSVSLFLLVVGSSLVIVTGLLLVLFPFPNITGSLPTPIGFESKTNLYDPRHKLRVKNEEIDSYLETLLEDYRKNLKII